MKVIYSTYKKFIWYAVVATLIVIGGYAYFSSRDSGGQKTFTVSRTSVEDRVSFSGNVRPAEKISLSFEKTGRIASLSVDVGRRVVLGEVLATLSFDDSQALLDQARASLLAEEATLADLRRGTRTESIEVAKTKVTVAELALASGLQELRDALADAYTKADDAVHNTLDPLFSNDNSSSPSLLITIADTQLIINFVAMRTKQEAKLVLWKTQNNINYPEITNDSLSEFRTYLTQSKILVDLAAAALANSQSNGSISQSNIDTWRSAVSIARTTLSSSISKLNSTQQTFTANKSALTLAGQDLRVLEAGSSIETINSQEARVASAQGKVAQYQAEVNKNILRSPIDGTVTAREAELGEIVAANKSILTIISNKNFQIESNVSELDIGKLVVGMQASSTLDAYGTDVVFGTKIIRVDPAETTVENSPAYGIRLEFISEDPRVKSGMTANITTVVSKRDNVLAVPIRTIKKIDGKSTVSVLVADNAVEIREITTGLTSPSGMVEVVSGLSENDQVLLPQGL